MTLTILTTTFVTGLPHLALTGGVWVLARCINRILKETQA